VLLCEVHVPDISIEEKDITPADLESADEVFITSSTRDLLPVLQVEDKHLPQAHRVREALQKAFSEYLDRYIAEHKGAPVTR
jgi:branched-chain amino acid aminotransferase